MDAKNLRIKPYFYSARFLATDIVDSVIRTDRPTIAQYWRGLLFPGISRCSFGQLWVYQSPPTVMDNNNFYETNLALSPHLVPEVEQGVQDEGVPHPVHGEGGPPDMAVVEQVEVGEQIGQNVRQRERTVKQEKFQDGQHPENANTSILHMYYIVVYYVLCTNI